MTTASALPAVNPDTSNDPVANAVRRSGPLSEKQIEALFPGFTPKAIRASLCDLCKTPEFAYSKRAIRSTVGANRIIGYEFVLRLSYSNLTGQDPVAS